MLTAAVQTRIPKILNFTTRRIALLATAEARNLITTELAQVTDANKQLDMLTGFSAALKGQRSVAMPEAWEGVETKLGNSANTSVRTLVQTLSLTFGSQKALSSLRQILADAAATLAARRAALDSLVGIKDPELPATLQRLLDESAMRGPAIRALGGYNDPKTPEALLGAYGKLDTAQKRDALNTLASRPAFAKPLLTSLAANEVPKADITADVLRQLRSLKDDGVKQQLTTVFGTFRESSADQKAEIEKYRAVYRAGGSQPGNASPGRLVYSRICAQCHTLFDAGGKVGPDITGANRTDLNYLLETIVDPNAVIPNEYRTSEIETKDGRSLTGVVKVMGDKSVMLQTANELLTIPRDEIESMRQTELSMMPEGLLAPLTDQEVRDLLYYLTRPGQVPLPEQAKTN
jgi:putative heme-binding domain-containing protein